MWQLLESVAIQQGKFGVQVPAAEEMVKCEVAVSLGQALVKLNITWLMVSHLFSIAFY